jgi:hypothetical protein
MIRDWTDDGWRQRFALMPIILSDGPRRRMIWLQWVWMRDMCLYTQISETDPRHEEPTDAS